MSKATVKEYSDKEIEGLDGYLQYPFNHDIYEELNGVNYTHYEDLFEPLEFFRVFYLAVEQVEQNKAKPLTVSRLLKKELCLYGKQQLTDKQRDFFYTKLLEYFDDDRVKDEQLRVCCHEIERLRENLDVEQEETPEREDEFDKALKHSETLRTIDEKIAYFSQEETKYRQRVSFDFDYPNYGDKCKLQIQHLEKLKRLEEARKEAADGIKKHDDLSIERATLFLDCLLDFANEKCRSNGRNTAKAKLSDAAKNKVIDLLTPYSGKQSIKLFALFKNEKAKIKERVEVGDKFYADMQFVRNYFEMLGFSEIVEAIDKDLGE